MHVSFVNLYWYCNIIVKKLFLAKSVLHWVRYALLTLIIRNAVNQWLSYWKHLTNDVSIHKLSYCTHARVTPTSPNILLIKCLALGKVTNHSKHFQKNMCEIWYSSRKTAYLKNWIRLWWHIHFILVWKTDLKMIMIMMIMMIYVSVHICDYTLPV